MESITQAAVVKRQVQQGLVVPAACYASADYVNYQWQFVGNNPSLCYVTGDFQAAFTAFQACTSANAGATAFTTVTELATPLSYCSSVISSVAAALSSASANAAIYGIGVSSTGATSSTMSGASSPTPSSTVSSPSATSTSATPAPSSSLSTGAKAGIAVGAILGAVAIIGLIFFLTRRQRQKKTQKPDQLETESVLEKAQLHSDDYKPKRTELVGSEGKHPIRVIDGMHEMEYHDIRQGRGEMSANEAAAREVGYGGMHERRGEMAANEVAALEISESTGRTDKSTGQGSSTQ